MQRMLVGLVVFLTAAVGVLAVMVFQLLDEIEQGAARPATVRGGRPSTQGSAAARIETLERQIDGLAAELKRLRDRPAPRRAPVVSPPAPARPEDGTSTASPVPGREPDAEPRFNLTEADEELFMELQRRVQKRQQIDGMTRNVFRRIDRLAVRGEMQPLTDEQREQLEPLVRRYVEAGNGLVDRYLRKPSERLKTLTAEQRRERLVAEVEVLKEQAHTELAPVLGEDDALEVAEQTLQNLWGLRFNRGRRGLPGRRRGN